LSAIDGAFSCFSSFSISFAIYVANDCFVRGHDGGGAGKDRRTAVFDRVTRVDCQRQEELCERSKYKMILDVWLMRPVLLQQCFTNHYKEVRKKFAKNVTYPYGNPEGQYLTTQ
jgi:hypothetical protein